MGFLTTRPTVDPAPSPKPKPKPKPKSSSKSSSGSSQRQTGKPGTASASARKPVPKIQVQAGIVPGPTNPVVVDSPAESPRTYTIAPPAASAHRQGADGPRNKTIQIRPSNEGMSPNLSIKPRAGGTARARPRSAGSSGGGGGGRRSRGSAGTIEGVLREDEGENEGWAPPPLVVSKGDRLGPGAFTDDEEDLPGSHPVRDLYREAEREREKELEREREIERERKREEKEKERAKVRRTKTKEGGKKAKTKGREKGDGDNAPSAASSRTALLRVNSADLSPPSTPPPPPPPSSFHYHAQQQEPQVVEELKVPFPVSAPLTLTGNRWSRIGRRTSSLQVNHTPIIEKLRISDNASSFGYSYRNSCGHSGYGIGDEGSGGEGRVVSGYSYGYGNGGVDAGVDVGVVEVVVAPRRENTGSTLVQAHDSLRHGDGYNEKIEPESEKEDYDKEGDELVARQLKSTRAAPTRTGFFVALRRRLCF
ncbi:hypothetical protein AX16_001633 [Volvariella volvacea WC 439]|nr:hypothetical protein AX16_001633 [Volvariella volvacea WC 439]